jgi:hypothetical protein
VSTHHLAKLPKFLDDHSRWLIEIPARILAIIVVTFLLRAIIHRIINRAVKPVRVGEVPRILRPFKERI